MTTAAAFRRVSPRCPCRICGRGTWCTVAADGALSVCMRVESAAPAANGGYIHHAAPDRPVRVPLAAAEPVTHLNVEYMQRRFLQSRRVAELAALLELPTPALRVLGVGFDIDRGVWTFPMRDADRRIIGFRTRDPATGAKKAIKGSRSGLFVPTTFAGGNGAVVCEGPTDTAAALAFGLNAIGRPDCASGGKTIRAFARRESLQRVVIVPDNDTHGAGLKGAMRLQQELQADGIRASIVRVPEGYKDVRDLYRAGYIEWFSAQVSTSEVSKDLGKKRRDNIGSGGAASTTARCGSGRGSVGSTVQQFRATSQPDDPARTVAVE